MTNKQIYTLALETTNSLLEYSIEHFSDIVITLAMSGEFAEVSDKFSYGEDVILSVGDFLNSSDRNIQNVIKILNCLRDFQDANE